MSAKHLKVGQWDSPNPSRIAGARLKVRKGGDWIYDNVFGQMPEIRSAVNTSVRDFTVLFYDKINMVLVCEY